MTSRGADRAPPSEKVPRDPTVGGLRSVAAVRGCGFALRLRPTDANRNHARRVPQRRRPPHLPLQEAPNQSAILLLTVCTDRRRPLLAQPDVAALLNQVWRQADAWLIGRFVVMPDHLHLFCTPAGRDSPSLAVWVKYWKTLASRQWPRPAEQPIWRQSFWDRQLRSGEHYSARWDYVRNNPVRHGLVSDVDAWQYQGELNVFRFLRRVIGRRTRCAALTEQHPPSPGRISVFSEGCAPSQPFARRQDRRRPHPRSASSTMP
jgi:putative transposase